MFLFVIGYGAVWMIAGMGLQVIALAAQLVVSDALVCLVLAAAAATLWQELHAYYRLAEMLDCTVAAVTDEQIPHGVGTSCYSTYGHALLLGLADPFTMTVRQIELTDRWLSQWSRKLFPYARQRESEGPVILIDLDSSAGATLAPIAPKDAPPELAPIIARALSRSPDDRFRSVRELGAALLDRADPATRAAWEPVFAPSARMSRLPAGPRSSLLGLLLLCCG